MFAKLLFTVNFIALVAFASNRSTYRKDYTFSQALNVFYKEHVVPLSWSDALITCNAEGSSLFAPSTQLEVKELLKIFGNGTYKSWLGIHDQFAEGVFVTLNGKKVDEAYINWWSNEPDDGFNANIKGEDCVILNRDGFYFDNDCSRKRRFLCQKPFFNITWNEKCDTYDQEYFHVAEMDKCFKIHPRPTTWKDSFRICTAEGSTLLMVKSNKQAQSIINHRDIEKVLREFNEIHIGHNDILVEGLELTNDGESVEEFRQFNKWNNTIQHDEKGRCRSMSLNCKFYKINCNQRATFVCEKFL